MRSRNIKPSFFKNENLAELPVEARLLFIGLWTMADCEGRLEDRPRRIKAEIFPYDELDVGHLLTLLHGNRFIYRYRRDGSGYICIPTWAKHQNPHKNERDGGSDVPAPDQREMLAWISSEKFGTDTDNIGTARADSPILIPDSPIPQNPASVDADCGSLPFDTLTPPPESLDSKQRRWFDGEIWPLVWRKADRTDAFKVFQKVCKTEGMKDLIVNAVRKHKPVYELREMQHRPHLATWLNKARYNEEPEEMGTPGRKPQQPHPEHPKLLM